MRVLPDIPGAAAARARSAPDPRKAIERMTDSVPILMFPVRLETRFRLATHELLVRVYPDDCLLDTFDPVLTDAEVEHAQKYWKAIRAAGADEGKQRAAWRELVEAHGSGRAGWVIDSYQPTNAAGDPVFDPVPTREHAWSQPA